MLWFVCVTVFGVVFVWTGVRTVLEGRRLRARVPGVVVALEWVAEGPVTSKQVAYPVLEFETADGRRVETRSDLGARPAPARQGQRVRVAYDPDDPAKARIAGFWAGSGLHGALFGVVGLVAVVGGLVAIFTY